MSGSQKVRRRFYAILAVAAGMGLMAPGPLGTAHAVGEPPLQGAMSQFKLLPQPLPAPEAAFMDKDGQTKTIADYKGRVVLLNLWATWCAPCVAEMPSLSRLQAAYPVEQMTVLTVSQDRNGTRDLIQGFYDKHHIEGLGIYLDPANQLTENLAVPGLPATFLFNTDGQLVGFYAGGAEWDSADAKALIDHFVAQP